MSTHTTETTPLDVAISRMRTVLTKARIPKAQFDYPELVNILREHHDPTSPWTLVRRDDQLVGVLFHNNYQPTFSSEIPNLRDPYDMRGIASNGDNHLLVTTDGSYACWVEAVNTISVKSNLLALNQGIGRIDLDSGEKHLTLMPDLASEQPHSRNTLICPLTRLSADDRNLALEKTLNGLPEYMKAVAPPSPPVVLVAPAQLPV